MKRYPIAGTADNDPFCLSLVQIRFAEREHYTLIPFQPGEIDLFTVPPLQCRGKPALPEKDVAKNPDVARSPLTL